MFIQRKACIHLNRLDEINAGHFITSLIYLPNSIILLINLPNYITLLINLPIYITLLINLSNYITLGINLPNYITLRINLPIPPVKPSTCQTFSTST